MASHDHHAPDSVGLPADEVFDRCGIGGDQGSEKVAPAVLVRCGHDDGEVRVTRLFAHLRSPVDFILERYSGTRQAGRARDRQQPFGSRRRRRCFRAGALAVSIAMRFTLDGEVFELDADEVRSRIGNHVPEPIREYWVEIDEVRWPVKQVISLATGVRDRQRFQSQASRRWLGRLGFTVGTGSTVTTPTPQSTPAAKPLAFVSRRPQLTPGVVLVGCVKSKLDHGAPAKELYVSDYFRKMRAYAEGTGVPWFILSAEHGLIGPEDWVEPYERYLPDMSREYRREWGQNVAAQLTEAMGPLDGVVVDIHAGSAYVESAEEALRPLGAVVVDQLQGLSFGRRLSWYVQHGSGARADGNDVAEQLRNRSRAVALDDLVAAGARNCGLLALTAGGSTRRVRRISAGDWGTRSRPG
jgi:hypothetical protein